MNEYDSDFLACALIHAGFHPVDAPDSADIIFINTCTVRAKPEQKAFSMIGRIAAFKKKKPTLILGVMGCVAQQQGANLIKRFPWVDIVIGPRELGRIQEILKKVITSRDKIVATRLGKNATKLPIPSNGYFKGKISSYISIMEGCNNFCTYCIVPFVRGLEVSRSPEDIIIEAKNLVSEGVKEITLLGQNVNSYFWDKGKKWNFVSLLRELNNLDGLLRLRFTTSHPKDFSDELITCFGDQTKLCPHIHLPFQAGSNRVLKRMKRGYTREGYLEIIDKLRNVSQDISITSDVMVGFPGESREDFELTLDLIKGVQFDGLFSFKYSDREGTLANRIRDKVTKPEKKERLRILQELQKQITLSKNRALKGKLFEVLVEGQSKRGDQLTGRTGTNKILNFIGNNSQINSLVKVKVKDGFLNSLNGELC